IYPHHRRPLFSLLLSPLNSGSHIFSALQPSSLPVNAFRYSMERPRFSDHLKAIKFICKDFWTELFKKQIDNLKTNHR
ncbi:hypothetical protein HN51_018156, partial [Arachis hypogaea]